MYMYALSHTHKFMCVDTIPTKMNLNFEENVFEFLACLPLFKNNQPDKDIAPMFSSEDLLIKNNQLIRM